MAGLALAKPPLRGLRQGSAQWLRPELRVRVKHLKAKGTLRHATVKQPVLDASDMPVGGKKSPGEPCCFRKTRMLARLFVSSSIS